MRLRRYLIFGFTALIVMLGSASSFGYDDPTPHGRISIVYEDDNIQPENRDVVKKIRAAGLFERMGDRLTAAVALPHDLEVVVTDNLPKDIDVATTELDGRRIFWSAAFSSRHTTSSPGFSPRSSAARVRPRPFHKITSQLTS